MNTEKYVSPEVDSKSGETSATAPMTTPKANSKVTPKAAPKAEWVLAQGEVTFTNDQKGFGFVIVNMPDNPEIDRFKAFFHYTDVVGQRRLKSGDKVICRLHQNDHENYKFRANKITLATGVDIALGMPKRAAVGHVKSLITNAPSDATDSGTTVDSEVTQ